MLTRVQNKLKTIVEMNENEILRSILNATELQEEIIYLNTVEQLFNRGEDSLGRTLDSIGGPYSPYTVQVKLRKGQPVDRVTLKDTGLFYESFHIVNAETYLQIVANPIKNGKDINKEWGGYVIGLQRENLKTVIDYIHEKFIRYIKKFYIAA